MWWEGGRYHRGLHGATGDPVTDGDTEVLSIQGPGDLGEQASPLQSLMALSSDTLPLWTESSPVGPRQCLDNS